MANVGFAVAVVLVLCSVTPSNAETTPPSGGGGAAAGGGDAHSMPCVQKLMPCQPYLHAAIRPPPSCCVPLTEIVKNDATCLCAVFTNVDMLKSLNLTKENALVLPKACGANADVSICKTSAGNTTTPSTSPATPKTPPASSTGNDSTGASGSSMAKPSNSSPAINFSGFSFASFLMALATIFF